MVARLTGVNGLLLAVALITGPLLARALGPEGRGELSAILTIFVLFPLVLDFGLADYLTRERARGARAGAVTGTTMAMALVFSLVGVALAVPFAELVSQERPVVKRFVQIALFSSPLLVFGSMLMGVARGEGRWSAVYRWRLLNGLGAAVLLIGLAAIGELTVESAAAVTVGVAFVAIAAALPVLRGSGPWRLDRAVVRPALTFGANSWLLTLSSVSNYRLDQIVMAAAVPSRDLGHYAVAASLTAIIAAFVGAVNAALLPRVAKEGAAAVPRICRVSVLVFVGSLTILAAIAPLFVPLVFGGDFRDSVILVEVLCVGTLFYAVSVVLGAALQGHGRPQDAARAQLLGVGITVVGLAAVLGPLSALGAALVNVLAGGAVATITLRSSVRAFGTPIRALLLPRSEDLRWLVAAVRGWHSG